MTDLVLVHGLAVSPRIWQPVIGMLERHHEVLAPTLAGHRGGPPLEPADGGVPALCDALERTLDEAGVERAHLVGSSLGGWAAIELARRGRAESVVAFSPLGSFRSPKHIRRIARTLRLYDGRLAPHRERLVQALRRPGLRRLFYRSGMEHPERMSSEAAAEMLDDMIGTTVLSELASWMENVEPYAADLPAGLPLRIAWGECDRQLPFADYGSGWLEMLPQAEHVTLPGCGHAPMYDDPALVAETILAVSSPQRDRRPL